MTAQDPGRARQRASTAGPSGACQSTGRAASEPASRATTVATAAYAPVSPHTAWASGRTLTAVDEKPCDSIGSAASRRAER